MYVFTQNHSAWSYAGGWYRAAMLIMTCQCVGVLQPTAPQSAVLLSEQLGSEGRPRDTLLQNWCQGTPVRGSHVLLPWPSSAKAELCVCHHTLSSSPQLPDTVVLWAPDQELLSPILLTRKNQNLFPPWVKHSSCPKLDQQQMGFKIRAVQEMVCEAMHRGKARLGEAAQSRFLPAFCIRTLFYLCLLCHSTTYIPLTLSCKSSLWKQNTNQHLLKKKFTQKVSQAPFS